MNPDFLEKLEKQEALLKQNYGDVATNIGDPVIPTKKLADTSIPQYIPPAPQESRFVPSEPAKAPVVEQNAGVSIKDRIAAMENALGSASPSSTVGAHKGFMDEYGNETFYVKNISNGHVTISDIDGVVIKRNAAVDLLQMADLDSIRKSRDLRGAMQMANGKQWLKRLTPEEYLQELNSAFINKTQIDKLKSVNQPASDDPNKIRPVVLSKLEKLNLGYKPDTAHLGMTPIEFVEWAITENLTDSELDYIIGSVTDLSIKKPLLNAKAKKNAVL